MDADVFWLDVPVDDVVEAVQVDILQERVEIHDRMNDGLVENSTLKRRTTTVMHGLR